MKRSQNRHVKTTVSEHVPSLAFIETHLLHKGAQKPNPSNVATGEEVQQMLPCCPVCSEEFYAPSDFDDLSAFLEFKATSDSTSSEASKNGDGAKIALAGIDESETAKLDSDNFHFAESRVKLSGKGKKKGRGNRASKSSKKSKKAKKGKGVVFAPANQKQQIQLAKPASVKQAEKSLGKSLPYDDRNTCCKICPGDRYPGLGLDALQPSFIEVMERGIKTKMGNGCCPICPSLASLSLGGAEPFGGPFGEGVGNMADAMTKAIQSFCKCYPNCPELVIQNHKGCRPQDIKTTITSFVETGEKKKKNP